MSSGVTTATVSISAARHVAKTRRAISPRFATSSLPDHGAQLDPVGASVARETRAGPPAPRRSSAARRCAARSRARPGGRGRVASRDVPLAGPPFRARSGPARAPASRSPVTSWTSPIRSAVAASKRSPVTKYRRAAPQRGDHRKRPRSQAREVADGELAIDFEPDDEEEDRQEPVIYPVEQRIRERVRAPRNPSVFPTTPGKPGRGASC